MLPIIAAGMMMMDMQVATEAPLPPAPDVDTALVQPVVSPLPASVGGDVVVVPPPVLPNLPGTAVDAPAAPPQSDDIVVTGRTSAPPGDPMERLNLKSFEAVQSVDKAIVEPVATAYNKGLPKPVRKGLRNFFFNLQEPVVFAAYMLQFKPGKAMETVGRFAINTTLGVGGLFDVAKRKPFFLPYRYNGVANVLGYYGVGPGPYMYLPLIGPTTLRDVFGDTVDNLVGPSLLGKPFNRPAYIIPAAVLRQLGERAAFDETIQTIRKQDDPYTTYKDMYLRQRKADIEALHGRKVEGVTPVYGPAMGKVPVNVAPDDAQQD